MQSHYVTLNNSTIHYRQFGNGPKLLFCFHGYGRESYTFSVLERRLSDFFTIIAIDIPFHGLTEWKDDLVFEPAYLKNLIEQIKTQFKKENNKINILGFSMGGRIALYMTQLMAEQVERLILVAPDGLNFNLWRWLASENWAGNRMLRYTINNPGYISWMVNKAEKLNVIHRSLADFIRYYIHDEEHRKLLYQRWTSTRKFSPNLRKLKQLIKKHKITVRMMFGSFDRVIPSIGGEKFREGIEQFASVKVVEAGHNLLAEANSRNIADLING